MSLNLIGVVWRSSWQLGEQEIPTTSRSSSPSRLLRPAQTVHLKSTKGSHNFITVVSTQSTCVSTLDDCPRSLF
ncbi:hypothetical protein Taro_031538 [Colocasia esculenta]|uniref:Uncharacterized protein n=1 Tax=Colocasia esculenta TaxID=4460 RepID=A0A843VS84_COLES|nr:hypothetical protein [Colocasia esculenta]